MYYILDLPGKGFGKQIPFLAKDDGIFETEFIEERRQGLEDFINSVAGHPLVQNEKCLHSFLQEMRSTTSNTQKLEILKKHSITNR